MTMARRIALARFVLAFAVVGLIVVSTLPTVATAGMSLYRGTVGDLRSAGHGLLSVDDGFVTAMLVTTVTMPVPLLVAVAGRSTAAMTTWRATAASGLGTTLVLSVLATRSAEPGNTWLSGAIASAVGLLLGSLVLSAVRSLEQPLPGRSTVRSRRTAIALAVVYGFGVVFVGFTGSPVDAGVHPQIIDVLLDAHRLGVPAWFGYSALEFTANVVFFMPLGLLVVLLLGAHRWWVGALAGLVVSCAIETGQALFLPARFASFDDVLANTSGAVIGACVGVVVLGRAARHRIP